MIIRSLAKSIGSPLLLALAAALPVSSVAAPELEYSYSDEWSVVSAPPPSGPYSPVHVDPRVPGQGVTPPVATSFEPEIRQAQDVATDVVAVPPAVSATTEVTADIPPDELPLPTAEVIPQQAQDIAEDVPVSPLVQPGSSEHAASDTNLPPTVTSAGQPPVPGRYGRRVPPVADSESVTPNTKQSRLPGLYDRMMPPAAGGVGSRSATRPPVPGQYGRMLPPSAPGFNYPGPNRQSGRPAVPGYMNMPPFGYYRAPANRPEDEVPPPSVYQRRPPYGGSAYPSP